MYICICKGITDKDIRNAVIDGANSYHSVRKKLDISNQCGRCGCDAKALVNETLNEISAFSSAQCYAAM